MRVSDSNLNGLAGKVFRIPGDSQIFYTLEIADDGVNVCWQGKSCVIRALYSREMAVDFFNKGTWVINEE